MWIIKGKFEDKQVYLNSFPNLAWNDNLSQAKKFDTVAEVNKAFSKLLSTIQHVTNLETFYVGN